MKEAKYIRSKFSGVIILILVVTAYPSLEAQNSIGSGPEVIPMVTAPPDSLNLPGFYRKYLNANGIAITASRRVPDSALVQAWKIISFMTADLPEDVLKAMIRVKSRVTVMARYEGTTDVPEHAHLASDTSLNWDVRARGLGGSIRRPLTSCAEENLLAYQIDKYHAEDILIHEFAHSIHLIGILQVDRDFNSKLEKLFQQAVAKGKYANTYARTNISEYWAEGVQNWFNVNAEVPVPDGKHNRLNTRKELKKYEPNYNL
ncbi:MAG TPA: hypothetical protein PK521_11860 [Bacteroidales bacterium]|nr:hypothetical protein [Bacteroidales bacterium]HQM69993.1 hypothetical protein [Bacteroidales bacterium]